MPESLSKLVQDVIAAYVEAKKDPAKAPDFNAAIDALFNELNQVRAQIGNLGKTALHDAAVRAIDNLLTIDEGTDLSTFFQQVGRALIQGQTVLDKRSILYNQVNASAENAQYRIPPTWFAIPNVKAEMKLGFSQVHGSGVNVVLFQNSEQKQRYAESTITFEIAAAPAPPNAQFKLPQAEPPPPGPHLESADLSEGAAEASILESVDLGHVHKLFDSSSLESMPDIVLESALENVPLRGDSKTDVVHQIADALSETQRKFLLSRSTQLSILPATREVKATQTYLVLAASRSPKNAPREVHVYYGQASKGGFVPKRTQFTHAGPLKQAKGLIAPSHAVLARLAKTKPQELRYLARNLGDALALTLKFAKDSQLNLDGGNQTEKVLEGMSKQVSADKNLLKVMDSAEGIFHDPRRKLYVVLNPREKSDSEEWTEFDAAVVSRPRHRQIVHIPSKRELSSLARKDPGELVLLVDSLKNLFRDLVLIFEHAKSV